MLRRGAAGLTALGVLAHAALLVTSGHDVGVAVLLAVMTVVCAGCAVKAWRSPDRRALGALIGMSLAMAVAHVVLALGPLAGHHVGTGTSSAATTTLGHGVVTHDPAVMLAVAALDVVAAWVAALALRVSR